MTQGTTVPTDPVPANAPMDPEWMQQTTRSVCGCSHLEGGPVGPTQVGAADDTGRLQVQPPRWTVREGQGQAPALLVVVTESGVVVAGAVVVLSPVAPEGAPLVPVGSSPRRIWSSSTSSRALVISVA